MASSEVALKSYVLKVNFNCHCYGCKEKLEQLGEIHGVQSIDIDAEQEKVTILGTGDPYPVIKELEKDKKKFELLWEQSPPINNNQEMQIVLHDQHMVAKQPELNIGDCTHKLFEGSWLRIFLYGIILLIMNLGMALKALDKMIAKKSQDCCRKNNHELRLKSYNKRFTCDGCKEDGFGSRYRCEQCDYELHKECLSPKSTISHELLLGITFEFSNCNGLGRCCDACGNKIHGYSYHCKEKGLDLHPRCSNLECKLCISGTDFVLRDKVLSKCIWCDKKEPSKTRIPGWSYVSTCRKYQFHVHCITQMVHEAWKKGAININDDGSMALETIDLPLMVKSNRNGGRGRGSGEFKKILRIFLSTVVATLLGDPTALIAPMFVELLTH